MADDNDSDSASGIGAEASSDAQAGENDAQSGEGVGMGGTGEGLYGGFETSVAAANEALGAAGLGPSGFGGIPDINYNPELAMAHLKAGNLVTALGYAVLGVLDTVTGFLGGKFGGIMGIAAVRVVIGILNITNPYAMTAIVVIGMVYGTKKGTSIGSQLGKDLRDAINSGNFSASDLDDMVDGLSDSEGEGGIESIISRIGNISDEDLEKYLLEGLDALSLDQKRVENLYRRRSNIIGTGTNGLFIE